MFNHCAECHYHYDNILENFCGNLNRVEKKEDREKRGVGEK